MGGVIQEWEVVRISSYSLGIVLNQLCVQRMRFDTFWMFEVRISTWVLINPIKALLKVLQSIIGYYLYYLVFQLNF